MGCMAQKDQKLVFERAPYVDLVVGPGQLAPNPELIDEGRRPAKGRRWPSASAASDGPLDEIKRSHETFDPLRDPTMRPTPFQAYLRIQIGCDKFCTYCIVPMTRGPEQGRPPQQILAEARVLADQGCKEITLLGQTVNSYKHVEGGRTCAAGRSALRASRDRRHRAAQVRHELSEGHDRRPAAGRARFAEGVALPARAAAKRLERRAGADETRLHRGRLSRNDGPHSRHRCPTAAVTSDFIVGFCGETDEDFQLTCDAVRECRFKNSFIFKYSERPGTKGRSCTPTTSRTT